MDKKRKENVMLVELAVQRELAYRKKVASLQSQADAELLESLLPLEVKSPSPGSSPEPNSSGGPELTGTKRQATADNLEFSPPPQLHRLENQIDQTFCKQSASINPSPRPYASSSSWLPGLLGQVQTDNLKVQPPLQLPQNPKTWVPGTLEQTPENRPKFQQPMWLPATKNTYLRTDELFCKVCAVRCSGLTSYEQHVNGRRHSLNLEKQGLDIKDSDKQCEAGSQRRWCGLCNLWCMDEISFMGHLGGRKHRDELARRSGTGTEITQQQRWCALCNIDFVSEDLLAMHFNKRHKAEMQKLENARKGVCEVVKQRFWCKVCDISCADQNSLNVHLQGKRHVLKLHEIKKKREMQRKMISQSVK